MPRNVHEDLVGFLRSNVDTSNISVTFSTSDDIHQADYDGGHDYPEIAVVSTDPVVPGGGDTRFTGMDPTGAGPIQSGIEVVLVDCWGGPADDPAYVGNSVHPDTVANELAREVWKRSIDAAADAAPSGYEWISADPPRTADDTESYEDTHFRDQVTVRLGYTESP